jgi:hypothetical protein
MKEGSRQSQISRVRADLGQPSWSKSWTREVQSSVVANDRGMSRGEESCEGIVHNIKEREIKDRLLSSV